MEFCFGYWGSLSRSSFSLRCSGADTMSRSSFPGARLSPDARVSDGQRHGLEASPSAISWPAVFGGTAGAIAVSLVLILLGSGFGLASASPWSGSGLSAGTLTVVTIIWVVVVQWISAGVGGYLTGRLRTKWANTHSDEVFFRDTAHGFIMWAVTTLIGVMLLASATTAVVGGAVRAVSTVGGGLAQGAAAVAPAALESSGYSVDTLFRAAPPPSGQASSGPASSGNSGSGDPRAEVGRILAQGLAKGDIPPADRTYIAQLIATQTGIPAAEAQKRVDDMIAEAKAAAAKAVEIADQARKAASKLAIFTAVSMLIGAFVACAAAALGGQQRDESD